MGPETYHMYKNYTGLTVQERQYENTVLFEQEYIDEHNSQVV